MFELLLASLFVAFFLAILEKGIEFIALFIPRPVVNATVSLLLSLLGNLLIGFPIRETILRVVATAFLSRVSLALAEKATDYRPAVVRSARE
jgi:membrane-associated phospholipid phosphatase